jgi:uncharacterized protein YkwD
LALREVARMTSLSTFVKLSLVSCVALVACSAPDPGIQYRGNGYTPPSAPTGTGGTGWGGGNGSTVDSGTSPPPGNVDASTGDTQDADSPTFDASSPHVDAGDGGQKDGGDSGAPSDSGAGDSGSVQALLARCVTDVNAARMQYGLTALARAADLETYAAQASTSDAMAGNLDGYFNNNGGAGVSSAEDEFNGGEFNQGASAQDVIDQGIQYEVQGYLSGNGNLLSQQYTQVGCGVATAGDGNAWVAIEYR